MALLPRAVYAPLPFEFIHELLAYPAVLLPLFPGSLLSGRGASILSLEEAVFKCQAALLGLLAFQSSSPCRPLQRSNFALPKSRVTILLWSWQCLLCHMMGPSNCLWSSFQMGWSVSGVIYHTSIWCACHTSHVSPIARWLLVERGGGWGGVEPRPP